MTIVMLLQNVVLISTRMSVSKQQAVQKKNIKILENKLNLNILLYSANVYIIQSI